MKTDDIHLEARVTEFLRRHSLLAPGIRLLVAASGGCDSTVLAHISARIIVAWKGVLTLATVHHGLRREAEDDVTFVRSLAAELGADFMLRRVDVPAVISRDGGTVQDVARRLRYRALEEMCDEAGATVILTAHHADDQAETLLAHFLRGAGPTGLTGIRPIRGRIARPLLTIRRHQLESWAGERGITWMHDASNESDQYRRNALRHHVLPAISAVCGDGWVHAVGGTARLYAMLGTFLDERCERLAGPAFDRQDESVLVREKSLNTSSEFEKLVVCRHALHELRRTEVTLNESLALLTLWECAAGTRQQLRGGVTAVREPEGLRLISAAEDHPPIDVSAGEAVRWGAWMLSSELLEGNAVAAVSAEAAPLAPLPGPCGDGEDARMLEAGEARKMRPAFTGAEPSVEYVDLDAVGEQWRLRQWTDEDRFEPLSFGRQKRVRDFLADRGIAHPRRRQIPVLEGSGGVFWICGVRLGQHAAVHRESTHIARLRYFRTEQDDTHDT
ncbi:MAG: tRNA lysidine(34) synthetase TilS [Bacteroidetes bacterium]|nr:tRNA lysidine(34) synthetase TilS [Bacteroidota bacterium]